MNLLTQALPTSLFGHIFEIFCPNAHYKTLCSAAMGQDDDVFVLDIGEPVCIVELASKIIHLIQAQIRKVLVQTPTTFNPQAGICDLV